MFPTLHWMSKSSYMAPPLLLEQCFRKLGTIDGELSDVRQSKDATGPEGHHRQRRPPVPQCDSSMHECEPHSAIQVQTNTMLFDVFQLKYRELISRYRAPSSWWNHNELLHIREIAARSTSGSRACRTSI